MIKRALVVLMAIGVHSACASDLCEKRLLPITEQFIAYFESLLTHRLIDAEQLQNFESSLERGVVVNPLQAGEVPHEYTRVLHAQQISRFLENPLDIERLRQWTLKRNRELRRSEQSRESTREETIFTSEDLNFLPVQGGRLPEYGDHNIQIPPFEMMQTHVTQRMWVRRMKSNPSVFKAGTHSATLENPIENVTWWAAAEFANRVSKEGGLRPYYDFDGIIWKVGTSAEEGTLVPDETFDEVAMFGTTTGGNGYRFLAPTEWVYIVKRICTAELSIYSWFKTNSGGTTHPVNTTMSSLQIDESRFSELTGNVQVWANFENLHLDSVGWKRARKLLLLGGGYDSYSHDMYFQHIAPPTKTGGIRLVRTLLKGETP